MAFVPLVLYPRSVGPLYTHGLSHFWRWFQLAAGYAYLGVRRLGSSTRNGTARLNAKLIAGRQARAERRAQARGGRTEATSDSPEPAPVAIRERPPEPFAEIPDPRNRAGVKEKEEHEEKEEKDDDLLAWLNVPRGDRRG